MKIAVVIPNWNGEDYLKKSIDSVLSQNVPCSLIVVDNGSVDSSRKMLESYGEKIFTIYHKTNQGFAGGVNSGIRYAIKNNFDAIALLNNDAIAEKDWLQKLSMHLKKDVGIVTSLILDSTGKHIDTTGDQMTVWGFPYPRGRGKPYLKNKYQNPEFVFGASGGASLYSTSMLKQIGLFDEDFFAYYEDVDLSWRAQLAGWRVLFVPNAKVYHKISATSSRLKGFTVYHSFKNMRLLVLKNTTKGLRRIIYPRFYIMFSLFQIKAFFSRNILYMLRGSFMGIFLMPKKVLEKRAFSNHIVTSNKYILNMLVQDLPEDSEKLRRLRKIWWKLRGKNG